MSLILTALISNNKETEELACVVNIIRNDLGIKGIDWLHLKKSK